MNTKWLVVLSDGTTWELVSPGIRLYKVDESKVAEIGDRIRGLADRETGIALEDLLAAPKGPYGDWSFEERIVAHMGGERGRSGPPLLRCTRCTCGSGVAGSEHDD